MKNFRTYQLAVNFYHLASEIKLPRHLRVQLEKASSSVALNLAEGTGRKTKKDQQNFFHVALGSMRESQAILDLAPREYTEVRKQADKLAAHVYQLVKSLD